MIILKSLERSIVTAEDVIPTVAATTRKSCKKFFELITKLFL